MDPLYAKTTIVLAWILMGIIRAGPKMRAFTGTAAKRKKSSAIEYGILLLAFCFCLLPFIWLFSSALSFADYVLHPFALVGGAVIMASGCWLLYRTHADLGRNFSYTLEIQEKHELVTEGIYRHIRHPMYSSFLVFATGHALVVPNYIAGPAIAVAFIPLIANRLGAEERMMTEEFGDKYTEYCRHTKFLIPGVY
ncbi:protein-S-isoprenylcysteine O-methyltransferase [bacterium]|nr:protein-S-isoprenylcysteine O-methyltransferase [bacterium]